MLALDILSSQNGDLKVDETSFQALSAEINGVIARVRASDPVVRNIGPRLDYEPGKFTLGLSGPLGDAVLQAFGGQEKVTSLLTGFQSFDTLNTQLCLIEARFLFSASVHWVELKLSDRLNVGAVVSAYKQNEGVANADPHPAVGDGPDIAARKVGSDWHLIFRDANGDCPAGCIGQTLYCFSVSEASVTLISEPDARSFPSMVELVSTWGRPTQALCSSPAADVSIPPVVEPPARPPAVLPALGGRP